MYEKKLNRIKELMDPDEQLLWSGKPAAFETMDKAYKPRILIKIVIALLAAGGFTWVCTSRAAATGSKVEWVVVVLLWLAAAYAIAKDFIDARSIKNGFFYALSDSKIYIFGDVLVIVGYAAISKAALLKDAAGTLCLICGENSAKGVRQNVRAMAVSCLHREGMQIPENLTIYGLEDCDRVISVLKKYLPV